VTLAQIREMPTVSRDNTGRTHESVFRSYHIVEKVKDLLRENTPAATILEIIEDLQDAPQKDHPRT
jgi:hypothetical protein